MKGTTEIGRIQRREGNKHRVHTILRGKKNQKFVEPEKERRMSAMSRGEGKRKW